MALLLAASLPGLGAYGQAASDRDLISMDLEDLTHVKVYTASRHLEDAWKAPSSVSIITAEDIRRYGWQTLADAIRSLRSFYTTNDRQYAYLGVRGFLQPGDYNSRVLVLVNGHRLNENVYDSALIGLEFPLDLDLIDHIEVVRGPGSSLYGTDAEFGVINIFTRQADGANALETAVDTGSYLGRWGRVTAMGSRGEISGVISATAYRSPGPSTLYFPAFASPATDNGVATDMDGSHLEQAFADVKVGSFRLQGLLGERIQTFPTASYGALFNNPNDSVSDARGYVEASFQHRFATQTELDVRAYYDAYSFVGKGNYPGPVLEYTKARADWVGAEATVSRPLGEHRITAGAQWEYAPNILQRVTPPTLPNALWIEDSSWLGAVYGEAELHAGPKLILHAGGRVDWSDEFAPTVSPRLAAVYSPTERTTLKYILGRAFRSADAYESFYVDDVTVASPPRPLVPEKILSNEVVVQHRLKPWLAVIADGYYNQLNRLIQEVPDGNTSLSWYVNRDRIRAEGLEAEVDAETSSGVQLRASYTAEMASDVLAHIGLADMPHTLAKFNGIVPAWRAGSVGMELLYTGALTDYQGTRVPGYVLPNVTFSTRPVLGGWQFSSSCYNLGNTRWYSPMGPNDPEDKIPMDGRTWRFKLGYRIPASERGGRR